MNYDKFSIHDFIFSKFDTKQLNCGIKSSQGIWRYCRLTNYFIERRKTCDLSSKMPEQNWSACALWVYTVFNTTGVVSKVQAISKAAQGENAKSLMQVNIDIDVNYSIQKMRECMIDGQWFSLEKMAYIKANK